MLYYRYSPDFEVWLVLYSMIINNHLKTIISQDLKIKIIPLIIIRTGNLQQISIEFENILKAKHLRTIFLTTII
jgi:hypothetical protein